MSDYREQLARLARIFAPGDSHAVLAAIEKRPECLRANLAAIANTLAMAGVTAGDIAEHGLRAAEALTPPYGRMTPEGAAECVAVFIVVGRITGPSIQLLPHCIRQIREAE